MHSLTLGRISISLLEPAPRAAGVSLGQRLMIRLRARRAAAEIAALDARQRADAGLPPLAEDPAITAFRLAPGPLWSAGLTPRPGDARLR